MTPPLHLPHTGPMRWLPESALRENSISTTIPPDHPFLRDGHLLPAALIEYLAQAAAATITAPPGRQFKQGVLVAIKNFTILQKIPPGTPLTLHVTPEKSLGPFTSAHLEAHSDNAPVATADMTFHLTFE